MLKNLERERARLLELIERRLFILAIVLPIYHTFIAETKPLAFAFVAKIPVNFVKAEI